MSAALIYAHTDLYAFLTLSYIYNDMTIGIQVFEDITRHVQPESHVLVTIRKLDQTFIPRRPK